MVLAVATHQLGGPAKGAGPHRTSVRELGHHVAVTNFFLLWPLRCPLDPPDIPRFLTPAFLNPFFLNLFLWPPAFFLNFFFRPPDSPPCSSRGTYPPLL